MKRLNLPFWLNSKKKLFQYFNQYCIGSRKTHRLFFDNGGDILLIAHIDTVQKPKFIRTTKKRIYAQGLDDRLGCAIAYYLQRFLSVDVLLCDYEEDAKSTAQYHETKEYNFILELDRAGVDFVDYGLAEDRLVDDFSECTEMNLGYGSFSDICFLATDIGCLNVGIGYHKAHSIESYAVKKEVWGQIAKIVRFIEQYGHEKYEQDRSYGMLPLDNDYQDTEDYINCYGEYSQVDYKTQYQELVERVHLWDGDWIGKI